MNSCPVCGYRGLRNPPRNFTICPSCGTEFESDDFGVTREEIAQRRAELRNAWIEDGLQWHSRVIPRPSNWDGVTQLLLAGFPFRLAHGDITVSSRLLLPKPHVLVHVTSTVDMTEKHKAVALQYA